METSTPNQLHIQPAKTDETFSETQDNVSQHLSNVYVQSSDLFSQDNTLQLNLFQMEKMASIGQLSSSVAHEMRNLLGMIRTATFNIDRALNNPDPAIQTNLDVITRSIARARQYIDNLLNLSRIPTGIREDVDIEGVIDSLLTLFSKEMDWRKIHLTTRYCHLPPLRIDRNMLQECLLNIILNAIQSMEQGGELTVRTEPWKQGVRIAVGDTGPGIAPEDINRIFLRFFTTKTDGLGTGLGLTIAQNLAQRLGGEVYVESQVNRGSTFYISLPNITLAIKDEARQSAFIQDSAPEDDINTHGTSP